MRILRTIVGVSLRDKSIRDTRCVQVKRKWNDHVGVNRLAIICKKTETDLVDDRPKDGHKVGIINSTNKEEKS